MSRRIRGLSPEDRALWERVAGSTIPLRPRPATPPGPAPAAAPAPASRPAPAPERPALPEFRIDSLARPLTAIHDPAPTLEQRLAAQTPGLDRRTRRDLTRGRLAPEGRLDLHGMSLDEARPELVRFVLGAQRSGKRLLLVITGKGRSGEDRGPIPQRVGLLRHQVPLWLTQPPLGAVVLRITPAHLRHGGMGAYYVFLRRSREARD